MSKLQQHTPISPLLFPAKNSTSRRRLAQLKSEGKIRQIGPRLYTSVPKQKITETVKNSWSTIVSTLFPGALISHRTALDYRPNKKGEIFLTSSTNRQILYPGLSLRFMRGPGPLEDDPKFLTLRASSLPRALLENLSTTRGTISQNKTVNIKEVEARLEQLLSDGGETAINRIRDRAHQISQTFGWKKEYQRLDKITGALLGTKHVKNLKSSIAMARASGDPYDPSCLERLQLLFGELRNRSLPEIQDVFKAPDHFTNKAFFEAYFSNYIEGTTFEIEEAENIIFNKKIPEQRPKDAHDITGTFKIVSDLNELRKTSNEFDDFKRILLARHKTMTFSRPEALPGQFKEKPNRAGDTVFVPPDLVPGTLKKGVALYTDLPPGLARAIFMMFLIADVHPFVDGNGRISRIMMNAELASAKLSTIIIPNVYREDYLLALRSMTRRHRPRAILDMLIRAQRFSNFEFSPYPVILNEIQRKNWFREPDEAKIVE